MLENVLSFLHANPSEISAWAAVFVALLSLCVTLWQLQVQRRHNFLSVKPSLHIHSYDWKDWSGLYVVNTGLGRAKLHGIELFVDGVRQPDWDHALTAIGIADPSGIAKREYLEGDEIAKETALYLVKLSNEAPQFDWRREDLKERLKRLKIRLYYKSLYQEKKAQVATWPRR